jgi:hypothetical protein
MTALRVLAGLVFLLISSAAHAADYYVSPSGDDAATGTEAQPWRTVQRPITPH